DFSRKRLTARYTGYDRGAFGTAKPGEWNDRDACLFQPPWLIFRPGRYENKNCRGGCFVHIALEEFIGCWINPMDVFKDCKKRTLTRQSPNMVECCLKYDFLFLLSAVIKAAAAYIVDSEHYGGKAEISLKITACASEKAFNFLKLR